jgi:hypothetical protein
MPPRHITQMLMVKNKRNRTHFIDIFLRRGGLPPLPPPWDLCFWEGRAEDETRDSPRLPDKVGRSKPNKVGGCFATIYLNVEF